MKNDLMTFTGQFLCQMFTNTLVAPVIRIVWPWASKKAMVLFSSSAYWRDQSWPAVWINDWLTIFLFTGRIWVQLEPHITPFVMNWRLRLIGVDKSDRSLFPNVCSFELVNKLDTHVFVRKFLDFAFPFVRAFKASIFPVHHGYEDIAFRIDVRSGSPALNI